MMNPESDRAPLRIEQVDDTTIVHLQTREVLWSFPGYEDAETLKEELKSLADQGHRDILLDLEMVEYAVSMFLGVLMLAERRLHETGGRLRLCSIQPDVDKAIRVCGLHRYFEIFPDIPTALAAPPRK